MAAGAACVPPVQALLSLASRRHGRGERLLARRSPAVPGLEDEVAPLTQPSSRAHLPDTLPAGTWHGHPARGSSMGGTPMPRAHLRTPPSSAPLLLSTRRRDKVRRRSVSDKALGKGVGDKVWRQGVLAPPTINHQPLALIRFGA